jgi:hypothetical protein
MDAHESSRRRYRALLGKLSGLGEDAIYKLKGRDKNAAVTLAIVFTMA